MYRAAAVLVALVGVVMLPGRALTQDQVPQQIRELIVADNDYTREHLATRPGATAADGSVEFWSSGGLRQFVPADAPDQEYDAFNLVAKHIRVISLAEGVAVAQYYVEGSYTEKGQAPVSHYMTRATQVFVMDGGEWKVRAAHWSPVVGGTGTAQTAVIR